MHSMLLQLREISEKGMGQHTTGKTFGCICTLLIRIMNAAPVEHPIAHIRSWDQAPGMRHLHCPSTPADLRQLENA